MYCFVILLLFNEMQMSVRRFSAIPHLRAVLMDLKQIYQRLPLYFSFKRKKI